jgi:hypothetical protein
MDRHRRDVPAHYSVAGLEDARDLRAAIAAALGTAPVNEQLLREGIWTYVGAERASGISPGSVIMALTGIVEAAHIVPTSLREALLRRVILWCVEAYFGHLGGVSGPGDEDRLDAPAPLVAR